MCCVLTGQHYDCSMLIHKLDKVAVNMSLLLASIVTAPGLSWVDKSSDRDVGNVVT